MDVNGRVQKVIDGIVARGNERALQVAAYWKGTLVVDAWAGDIDASSGRKINGDTLFPVFSTTKGIAATAVHILAERGVISYDERISTYWPEFGCNGKEGITLRMALNHTAALPHMPELKAPEEISDWDHMCRLIAEAAPLWEPGTRTQYHAITYSWLIGETVRRADGRDFGTIIREEIAKPLGLARSLFVGLPASEDDRVAILEPNPDPPPPDPNAPPPDPVAQRAIPSLVCPLEKWMNLKAARRGCICASNGIMNARAIARHYAAVIGTVDGVRLIPESRLEIALAPFDNGEQPEKHWALGYSYGGPANDRAGGFGHGGAGGSIGSADRRAQLVIGMTKSSMGTGKGEVKSAGEQVVSEIRSALAL